MAVIPIYSPGVVCVCVCVSRGVEGGGPEKRKKKNTKMIQADLSSTDSPIRGKKDEQTTFRIGFEKVPLELNMKSGD